MFYAVVAIYGLLSLGLAFYSRFLFTAFSIFTILNGWRLVSSSYIASQSLTETPEIERYVTSVVPADIILMLSLCIFLFCFVWVFNPKAMTNIRNRVLTPLPKEKKELLIKIFSIASVTYILFILATFIFSAPIWDYPIISGMHRRDFIGSYGRGELISFFYKTLTYSSVFFGTGHVFFTLFRSKKPIISWLPLTAWLFCFSFLIVQGHRFSTLLWCIYFFALPVSLLFLSKQAKKADHILIALSFAFSLSVVSMFAHSFFIGGYHATEKSSYLTQRILVDQSQLWNLTATRVYGFENFDPSQAVGTILEPFFASSVYNRSAQFLMFKELGAKAYESWSQNHIITMGYPESFIDIVGGEAMFLWTFVLGVITAYMFFLFFKFLASFQIFSAIIIAFLLNPMIYFFTGGTANAVFSLSYLAKIILAIILFTAIHLSKKIFFKNPSQKNLLIWTSNLEKVKSLMHLKKIKNLVCEKYSPEIWEKISSIAIELTEDSTDLANFLFDFLEKEADSLFFDSTHYQDTYKYKKILNAAASEKISSILRILYPKESFDDQKTLFQDHKVTEAVEQLNQNGYYIYPEKLDQKTCDSIIKQLGDTPFTGVQNFHKKTGYHPNQIAACPDNLYRANNQNLLLTKEPLRSLSLDKLFLNIAQAYLGSPPIHMQTNCWWSKKQDTPSERELSQNAQLFHRDKEFIKFLKVFIYLTDVTEKNGPHIFIPKSHKSLPDFFGEGKDIERRFSEDELKKNPNLESPITLTGPRGTIIFEDTYGFHKGSPVDSDHRLMFQLEYSNSLYFRYSPPFLESHKTHISLPKDSRVLRNYNDTNRLKIQLKEKKDEVIARTKNLIRKLLKKS